MSKTHHLSAPHPADRAEHAEYRAEQAARGAGHFALGAARQECLTEPLEGASAAFVRRAEGVNASHKTNAQTTRIR